MIEYGGLQQAEGLRRIQDGLLMVTPFRRVVRLFQNARFKLLQDRFQRIYGTEVVTEVAGARLSLDLREMHDVRMFADISRHGAYEPETTRLLTRLLAPGDTFVDVGANNGYFALIAGRCVGAGGTVVAIEPNPAAVERLARNVALNELATTIRILPIAVGESDGEGSLYVSTFEDGWTSLVPFRGSKPPVSVRVAMLDHLLAPCDSLVLKVDTEGTELHVVRGMSLLLESARNVAMILEWNHLFGTRTLWESLRSRFHISLIRPDPSAPGVRLQEVREWDQLRSLFLGNLLLTSGPRWTATVGAMRA